MNFVHRSVNVPIVTSVSTSRSSSRRIFDPLILFIRPKGHSLCIALPWYLLVVKPRPLCFVERHQAYIFASSPVHRIEIRTNKFFWRVLPIHLPHGVCVFGGEKPCGNETGSGPKPSSACCANRRFKYRACNSFKSTLIRLTLGTMPSADIYLCHRNQKHRCRHRLRESFQTFRELLGIYIYYIYRRNTQSKVFPRNISLSLQRIIRRLFRENVARIIFQNYFRELFPRIIPRLFCGNIARIFRRNISMLVSKNHSKLISYGKISR